MADRLMDMAEEELTGEINACEAAIAVQRMMMETVVTELQRRATAARLARLAAGLTAEELAAMQTIKALGVPSEEAFGSADTRSK